jgi:hypothetical protein
MEKDAIRLIMTRRMIFLNTNEPLENIAFHVLHDDKVSAAGHPHSSDIIIDGLGIIPP